MVTARELLTCGDCKEGRRTHGDCKRRSRDGRRENANKTSWASKKEMKGWAIGGCKRKEGRHTDVAIKIELIKRRCRTFLLRSNLLSGGERSVLLSEGEDRTY